MSGKVDHIALYREEQKVKYQRRLRQQYLFDKYQNLLEFDKKRRSASRIIRAIKKHLLPNPSNTSSIATIPGRFRLRLKMTDLNMLPYDVQNDIIKDSDPITEMIIRESYKELCWVVIDLRLYGACPEMGIYVPEIDLMLYLNHDQINRVKYIWSKVNPDSANGIRFDQMLACSKALNTIYNR